MLGETVCFWQDVEPPAARPRAFSSGSTNLAGRLASFAVLAIFAVVGLAIFSSGSVGGLDIYCPGDYFLVPLYPPATGSFFSGL